MTNLREGMLLGMGNPLLDITVNGDTDLLNKYQLDANNAILGGEAQKDLCQDLVDNYDVQYTAGGATQNSLRVAQWVIKTSKVATFMGSVGKDIYSKILQEKATSDGVNVVYQYHDTVPTGICSVIVTQNGGSHRSLCAELGAANCFTIDHIHRPENHQLILNADYYYISGFFLTVSPDSILEVAGLAAERNKLFMMNLSAQFICQFFKQPQMKAMPYVDILFGNETELATFGAEQNFPTTDLREIMIHIVNLPKINTSRKRMVIITQGHEPVLYSEDGVIKEIAVPELTEEEIVDTNGAGDAFVGGFLGQLVLGKNVVDCIKCGIWTAGHIVQRSGCTFDNSLSYNG